ncbi:DMT family transporter [Mangrovicoccus sp. HB161399]|uniref:DMT family transporter n=1 Tax=Mangrovicoccus sp. HB161399 TaxID=2720392 RepID=UPI0015561709|nr:DMT family transporter [Mangrovicoccus sp. HB161399]
MNQNTALGIGIMIAACFVFSTQDGFSRLLASQYSVLMIVMIRYWAHAAYVLVRAARQPGGIRAVARTRQPGMQILRSSVLTAEICLAIASFTLVGLVTHTALFSAGPLLVTALSGPILGEKIGWRRWTAVAVGMCGILVIIGPGSEMFGPLALMPLGSAFLFALYGVMNRYVARQDNTDTSFFWTGITGAAVMTPIGLWAWQPMDAAGWAVMAVLCCTAILGHWLYIRCYEVAEASAIQPFAYFHLLFASIVGIVFFADPLVPRQVLGAAVVVGAGIFTWWRERQRAALPRRL